MKQRTNIFKSLGMYALCLIVAFASTTACSAMPPVGSGEKKSATEQKDSVMQKAISDSIYSIIKDAKTIKVEAVKISNDSLSTAKEVKLSTKDKQLLSFIITDPSNYLRHTIVYGKFRPFLTITFSSKTSSCMMNFDFGLRQWNICDSKGRQIKIFDLESNDILRFANILFPENQYFINFLNDYNK